MSSWKKEPLTFLFGGPQKGVIRPSKEVKIDSKSYAHSDSENLSNTIAWVQAQKIGKVGTFWWRHDYGENGF